MKSKLTLSLCCLLCTYLSVNAQRLTWESGADLSFLKGEKTLNLEYDLNNILVGEEEEGTFLEKRKKEAEEKKPGEGKGDAFIEKWQKAKNERYPKYFEETFNKETKKLKLKTAQNLEANYTMILKLIKIKIGGSDFWTEKPAYMTFEITIVESNNPEKILAKGLMENAKGEVSNKGGGNYVGGSTGRALKTISKLSSLDPTNRMAQCYKTAAIKLSAYFMRKLGSKKKK